MKKAVLAAALAAALASPLAMANDQGVYVGASVGSSKYDGLPNIEKGTGGKLVVGYSFNPNVAVEASYLTFGSADFSEGFVRGSVEVKGFNASLVLSAPLSPELSVHGKVGYFDGKGEGNAAGFKISEKGSDPSYGLGLTYMFNKNTGARLEWDRVGRSDAVDMISAGVVFKFK